MVNNAFDVLEEPVMRHVAQHEHVLRNTKFFRTHASPALGKQYTSSACNPCRGLEDDFRHGVRIVQNNTSESNVYRWWPIVKELLQLRSRGIVRGQIQKVETRDRYMRTPVFWFRNKSWRPAVRMRNFEALKHSWSPDHTHGL
jgi:hypothetical protein